MTGSAASPPPVPGVAAVRRASQARATDHSPLTTFSALFRVLIIGMFLLTFLVQPFRIPSASMVPTLQIGDFVLVSKIVAGSNHGRWWERLEGHLLAPAGVRRGDLVVFHFPPNPSHDLVKRVVALPGERLQMRAGHVFINGQPLPESYAVYTPEPPEVYRDEFPNLHEADPNVEPHWWLTLRHSLDRNGELTVPDRAFFVLGDNRNHSEDSRYWGFVPQSAIIGRPLLIYFAVPNGADAPDGGPVARIRWLLHWARGRVGVPR